MPPQSQAFSLHRLVFPAPYSHSFCASAASRTGYESACEDFVPDDLEVQVAGRAFLVTGGKSGIGKATAIEIAKRGEQPAVCPLHPVASLQPLYTGESACVTGRLEGPGQHGQKSWTVIS